MSDAIDLDAYPFFIPLKTGKIISKSGVLLDLAAARALLGCYEAVLGVPKGGAFPAWLQREKRAEPAGDAAFPPWLERGECEEQRAELMAAIAAIEEARP